MWKAKKHAVRVARVLINSANAFVVALCRSLVSFGDKQRILGESARLKVRTDVAVFCALDPCHLGGFFRGNDDAIDVLRVHTCFIFIVSRSPSHSSKSPTSATQSAP